MFDLDKEIDDWCESIRIKGWNRTVSLAELKDHLCCEVERLVETGVSPEEAFRAATEQMGDVDELREEYAKNRSVTSRLTEVLVANSQIPAGEDKMKLKTWLPTIISAVGMLIGGLLGALAGMFAGTEMAVVACYAIGFIGGAVVGGLLGRRFGTRQPPSEAEISD